MNLYESFTKCLASKTDCWYVNQRSSHHRHYLAYVGTGNRFLGLSHCSKELVTCCNTKLFCSVVRMTLVTCRPFPVSFSLYGDEKKREAYERHIESLSCTLGFSWWWCFQHLCRSVSLSASSMRLLSSFHQASPIVFRHPGPPRIVGRHKNRFLTPPHPPD